jgi:ketosteroid isomerase-like protein
MANLYSTSCFTEADILSLEKDYFAAVRAHDHETLSTMLHDDMLLLAPAGETLGKQAELDLYRTGKMKITSLKEKIEEIRIVEDSVVVTLFYETKGFISGQPFDGNYRYIRVWKHTDEGAKIIAASCHRL